MPILIQYSLSNGGVAALFVMELSGLEVLALVKEIDSALAGSYVNNIYTLGDAQLIRFRKREGEDIWLVASPSKGVWISDKVTERQETAEFTSRLRRELERARFTSASQVDLDRIFKLTFDEEDRTKNLIVELMPPGNITLTDQFGRILMLKREVRTSSRRLFRGGSYSPPVQKRLGPSVVRPADVTSMARAESTVGRAIGRHIALSRKYVEEVLSRLSLEEESASSALVGKEDELVRILNALLDEVGKNPRPCLVETDSGDEIFSIPPIGLKAKKAVETISALCDELLLPEVVSSSKKVSSQESKARRELEVTISNLELERTSLLHKASRLRALAADATSADSISEARTIILEGGVDFKVDLTSPAAAASFVYDRAKEHEKKAADINETIARLTRRIPKMGKKGGASSRKLPRHKMEWYEKFRWFHTSGGKLAIGGRDAHSNSLLVRRHLDNDDVVFHADLFGSPFFVLKGGRDLTEAEAREVAQATVAFSSAWKTGLSSADAYWVLPEQVSSAAPSGEYLSRGSFAINGKKNFVTGNLVEVAIGVTGDGRLVSGPESALASNAKLYIVLRPQKEKSSETAKRVLRDLIGPSDDIAAIGVDDVMRALPAGGGKVVRKVSHPRPPERS